MKRVNTVSWGVLSTAKIAVEKVIPAMQTGQLSRIDGIASRDASKAQSTAHRLGIPKAYASYAGLIADPAIQAVYIPLPNHMHVPWAVKCLETGKHVLCEKPLAMDAREAVEFESKVAQFPKLKVMEAFMYRFHPQWATVRRLLQRDAIGTVRWIHSYFLYHNTNPNDIRNRVEAGGGGLLDIGCYCISVSRFLFGGEPIAVRGSIDLDPTTGTDRMASGILEFPNGSASFTCSTQSLPGQGVIITGTKGRIIMEFPFTPPPETITKIVVETPKGREEVSFSPCNQYTLQGDAFSRAILDDSPVPTDLSDAVRNMQVIDQIKKNSGRFA